MRRKNWIIAASALVVLAGGGSAVAADTAQAGNPPECSHVVIADNSGAGPKLYVTFCGTGSQGETPVPQARYLVVDGSRLNARSCTRLNPCVVLWPASPRS